MKKIFIFGIGTLADLARFYIKNDMDQEVFAYIVDDEYKFVDTFAGAPVFGWSDFVQTFLPSQVSIFCAIGYSSFIKRALIFEKIADLGFEFFNIICKNVYLSKSASLGKNIFLMPGTVIEPKVSVGHNNIFWSNVTICHDVTIGDHNFFAANTTVGGFSQIGSKNFFGFSSILLQEMKIGNSNLIGAASLVNKDVLDNVHIHGVPARVIKMNTTK